MSDAFSIITRYLEVYIGLHIVWTKEHRIFKIDRSRYICKYGFDDCHVVTVPADPTSATHMSSHGAFSNEPLADDIPYQECISTWQWVISSTQLDISYAINRTGQYSTSPHNPHVFALKRVMKYLHNTADYKITYGGDNQSNLLIAYVDVDFAMDLDDRRSHSDFLLIFNGGPIT